MVDPMTQRNHAMTSKLLLAASLGAFVATAGAQQSPDAIQRHFAEVRARYDAEHWTQGARRAGFELGALTLSDLTGGASEFLGGTRVVRSFADAQGVKRVLVEMDVFDTVAAAHDQLVQAIASVSSTKTLPTTASKGWSTGDAGFIGYSGVAQDRVAWIAFAVGNLAFRVVSLDPAADPQPDLGAAAVRVAQAAAAGAPLAAGAALPRPQVASLALDRERCAIGETIGIDAQVTDSLGPLGKVAKVDFEVGGPGQGYVEPKQGRLLFHATGAGKVTLTLNALGSNGTVAAKTITLEVTAR